MTDVAPPGAEGQPNYGWNPPPPPDPLGWSAPRTILAAAGPGEEPAGFWRRYWARVVTGVTFLVISGAVAFGLAAATTFLASAANDSRILLGGGVVIGLAVLIVFYLVCAKPLAKKGSTIGMRQLGLHLHRPGRDTTPTVGTATLRTALGNLPWVVLSMAPYAYVLADTAGIGLAVSISLIIAGVITTVGGLWNLVDDRRRTMWDIVANTEVTSRAEPSWVAVLSFVLGLTIPLIGTLTVIAVGVQSIRRDAEDAKGVSGVVHLLLPTIPALLVSAVTIVVGVVAVRSTAWEADRLAGRGLAQTGLMLGWSIPVLLVVSIVFGVVYTKIEDRTRLDCTSERKAILAAITSYQNLNGTLPRIEELAAGVYLDNKTLAERWTMSGDRPVGKGDCKSSR